MVSWPHLHNSQVHHPSESGGKSHVTALLCPIVIATVAGSAR